MDVLRALESSLSQLDLVNAAPSAPLHANPSAFCSVICVRRNLHWNNLTGTVPAEWGNEDAFMVLENL